MLQALRHPSACTSTANTIKTQPDMTFVALMLLCIKTVLISIDASRCHRCKLVATLCCCTCNQTYGIHADGVTPLPISGDAQASTAPDLVINHALPDAEFCSRILAWVTELDSNKVQLRQGKKGTKPRLPLSKSQGHNKKRTDEVMWHFTFKNVSCWHNTYA